MEERSNARGPDEGAVWLWEHDHPLDGCEFAARLQRGTTVLNSMCRDGDPETIDVAHVGAPDDDGMVIIRDVSGYAVRCAGDTSWETLDREVSDLIEFLVATET